MSDTQNTNTITLGDLKNVLVFIDLCTQRGALRANELGSVASLYEKINRFVSDAEKRAAEAVPPVGPASDTAEQAQ
jgi:hypothetical protein